MLQRVFVNNIFQKIGQIYVLYTSKFLKTSKSGNFDFFKFVLYRPQNKKFHMNLDTKIFFPKIGYKRKFQALAHSPPLTNIVRATHLSVGAL